MSALKIGKHHLTILTSETHCSAGAIAGVVALLDDDATVPFIARYRKEQTGSMDEELIRTVRDRVAELRELDKRREAILSSLAERDLLTEQLEADIAQALSKAELEDLYLPYRPKRRTRAQTARERGLEPLADAIAVASGFGRLAGARSAGTAGAEAAAAEAGTAGADGEPGAPAGSTAAGACGPAGAPRTLSELASTFVADGDDLPDATAALEGARDIIAERVSENAAVRAALRELFERRAVLAVKRARGVDTRSKDAAVYSDYFDYSESASKARSHRILAVLRGEREGFLSVHVLPDEETALEAIRTRLWAESRTDSKNHKPEERGSDTQPMHPTFVRECRDEITTAQADAWKRLLAPSLENERKSAMQTAAEQAASVVFARNLRELLLAAPMGGRPMLAVDPGLRTGCKIVCLDEHGELLHHEAIYPLPPRNDTEGAAKTVRDLCARFAVEVIAVGNGTGGREAQRFLSGLGVASPGSGKRGEGDANRVPVISVNEAGASVYSASTAARAEFPDHDVTVRGAVSIGRRLMDPLAELVKIDPKSIGVGQYQHDVDARLLEQRLADTVVSCVNSVGADLNTASEHLLRYVAGLNTKTASAVVRYRREHGTYRDRRELLKVSGLGRKAFEQAAGFLRVDGVNPLDRTSVHPERYPVVERMAADAGVAPAELVGNAELCRSMPVERYIDESTGLPTLNDIVAALSDPGRDPRPEFDAVEFRDDVSTIGDLKKGMRLSGVVTNITDFGAFVDIGVHRDGLVHISRLADRFVKDPHEIVSVGAAVEVTVTDIDPDRGRISLSMV